MNSYDNETMDYIHYGTKLEITGRLMKLLSYSVFLTACESIILGILIKNDGKCLSATQISEMCGKNICTPRSVVTHIYTLNQKAAPIISRQLVLCQKGEGYIINSKV